MDSRLLTQRTGSSGRLAALFLLLAVTALSVVLLRPICEATFKHPAPGQHSAACCESVADGSQLNLADMAPPGPSAKPIAASFAYPIPIAFLAPVAVMFTTALAPTRSYYSRSARILR
ncbi:MAG: hypothetical protein EPO20_00940 [Betaproteobacteria bacterium]|nr:MAG: hypothetical protein EPO20_00940 [Betaproteobacteria bacterium]